MMKKLLVTLMLLGTACLSMPQASAYSELDYLEGSWYDANGKLFAVVNDGVLNTREMEVITVAGGEKNFVAAVQVKEADGIRNIPLEYNSMRDDKAKNNPFYRPVVKINGVSVHKEWFNIPQDVYQMLYGNWFDEEGNIILQFRQDTLNTYPITFLSFYGTAEHFDATFKLAEEEEDKFFSISLVQDEMGRSIVSIRRMNTEWGYDALTQR